MTIIPETKLPPPVADIDPDDDGFYTDDDYDEPEPQPAPPEPEPAKESEPAKEPAMVPVGALAELRAERNKLRDERRQEREALLEVIKRLQPAGGQPQQGDPGDLTPKPGEQDGDYLARVIQHLVTEAQETRAERQRREHAEAQQRQYQTHATQVVGEYEAYMRETGHDDLQEAGSYLVKPMQTRMEKAGFPKGYISAKIAEYENDLIALARHTGVNPGKIIYDTAVADGYVPKAQRAAQEEAAAKRAKAEQHGRGLGGAPATAGGMTQLKAAALFNQGAHNRTMKLPELGGITLEEALSSGKIRSLPKGT